MFGVVLSISSPNNRGMHVYSKSLFNLIRKKTISKLIYPKKQRFLGNKMEFFNRIIWEIKPINISNINSLDFFISGHPRYPIDILLNSNKFKNKKILVIHDYMLCTKLKDLLSYKYIFKNLHNFWLLKSIYHTLLFKLSVSKSDYFIFNSFYTKDNLKNWVRKNYYINKDSLVIHPIPSFSPKKVCNENKIIKYKTNKQKKDINILFVTGLPKTKRSELIMPIIKKLAEEMSDFNFFVSVVGIFKLKGENLPRNIFLNIPKQSLSEKNLIQRYLNADIFISTSSDEGFGIPLLDAITFEISSIATSIPAYEEIKKVYKSNNLFLISQNSQVDDYINAAKYLIQEDLLNRQKNRAKSYDKNYFKIYKKSEMKINSFLNNHFNNGSINTNNVLS